MNKSLIKLSKYDFLVFFREPFFALPIMILPGIFFFVFMKIFSNTIGGAENFGPYIPIYGLLISFLVLFFNIGLQYVTEKERGFISGWYCRPSAFIRSFSRTSYAVCCFRFSGLPKSSQSGFSCSRRPSRII
ncbi:hypothetical protein ACPJHQ_03730 [Rossellomorea sp. H39__3]